MVHKCLYEPFRLGSERGDVQMTPGTERAIGGIGAVTLPPGERGGRRCPDIRDEREPGHAKEAGGELDTFLESVLALEVDASDGDERANDRGPNGLTQGDRMRVSAILESAISENTRMNYGYQWKLFSSWAREREADALPAEPSLVAAYLAERAELHEHRPATLRAAAAAIAFVHRSAELNDPCATE